MPPPPALVYTAANLVLPSAPTVLPRCELHDACCRCLCSCRCRRWPVDITHGSPAPASQSRHLSVSFFFFFYFYFFCVRLAVPLPATQRAIAAAWRLSSVSCGQGAPASAPCTSLLLRTYFGGHSSHRCPGRHAGTHAPAGLSCAAAAGVRRALLARHGAACAAAARPPLPARHHTSERIGQPCTGADCAAGTRPLET